MTAKDGSASEEQGWDLNLGLLGLTLSFSQLLSTFHVTEVTSKAKVRILEFITEETGLWTGHLPWQLGSGTEFVFDVESFPPEMGWVGMEW